MLIVSKFLFWVAAVVIEVGTRLTRSGYSRYEFGKVGWTGLRCREGFRIGLAGEFVPREVFRSEYIDPLRHKDPPQPLWRCPGLANSC